MNLFSKLWLYQIVKAYIPWYVSLFNENKHMKYMCIYKII